MSREPSRGLRFLRQARLLRFFPELAAMVDVPQDPHWHPEGDVWTHTLMVVDAAAGLRDGGEDDLALMFAALCHDFGKPETTVTGVLEVLQRGGGFLRDPARSLRPDPADPFVPDKLVKRARLVVGATVSPKPPPSKARSTVPTTGPCSPDPPSSWTAPPS